jgi:hypothetical protein
LIHLVGLGLVVRQRRAIGGGERAGLDLMPQPQQMLTADPDLSSKLRSGNPLRNASEDQEDLRGAQMSPLPRSTCEHIEHPSAALAARVDDRRVGPMTVDVEAVPSTATGTREPIGMKQIEERPAATLPVHQVDDREVHEIGSKEMTSTHHTPQRNTSRHARKEPTTNSVA